MLLILKSELIFVHYIEFVNILSKSYIITYKEIKENLKELWQVHLALNIRFNFQEVTYLDILIYWMNSNYKVHI